MNTLTITYTGTLAESYKPEMFFWALKRLNTDAQKQLAELRIVGTVSNGVLRQIEKTGTADFVQLVSYVPHKESIKYLKKSDLLLLIIPEATHAEGIVTGKLFNYLACGKPIICLGPTAGDAALIIKECQAGEVFDRHDMSGVIDYLKFHKSLKIKGTPNLYRNRYANYSRRSQANKLLRLLNA